jgi:hypothetical protein
VRTDKNNGCALNAERVLESLHRDRRFPPRGRNSLPHGFPVFFSFASRASKSGWMGRRSHSQHYHYTSRTGVGDESLSRASTPPQDDNIYDGSKKQPEEANVSCKLPLLFLIKYIFSVTTCTALVIFIVRCPGALPPNYVAIPCDRYWK